MAQSWYDVVLYNGLIAIEGTLRAVSLNIPFKPIMKVLSHCEPSWWGVYALFQVN